MKKIIAVIGANETTKENLKIAEDVGALIAKRGAILITGGMAGVMEAASKGARKEGGLVIGILPTADRSGANPYVDIPIVTGMNQARNIIICRTCDCAIAVDGRYGTLSEIAFCMMFTVPVVGINTWQIDAPIHHVASAEDAVKKAFELMR
jgi:uncharacterized protein (TIGR00725 family)